MQYITLYYWTAAKELCDMRRQRGFADWDGCALGSSGPSPLDVLLAERYPPMYEGLTVEVRLPLAEISRFEMRLPARQAAEKGRVFLVPSEMVDAALMGRVE